MDDVRYDYSVGGFMVWMCEVGYINGGACKAVYGHILILENFFCKIEHIKSILP